MGSNEIILLQLALETIKLILDRQKAGEEISDDELEDARQKRKEAVARLEKQE